MPPLPSSVPPLPPRVVCRPPWLCIHTCRLTYFFRIMCCSPLPISGQPRDAQDRGVLRGRGPGGQALYPDQHIGEPGLRGACLWAGLGGEGLRHFFLLSVFFKKKCGHKATATSIIHFCIFVNHLKKITRVAKREGQKNAEG